MITAIVVICAIAAGYQVTALLACLRQASRRKPAPADEFPGISVLKPVRGADARFDEAIRSHARIRYPRFEILFGVSDPSDSAAPHVERLRREFPDVDIRVLVTPSDAPNAKAGRLATLSAAAKYPVHVVNDADVRVEPDYLNHLAAELLRPGVGLVTCLYRATGDTFAARFEALGIATDFAPSALVAPLVGVNEFGLGSTLAYRAADFDRAGGWDAIRDYIADDYQAGKRLSRLGLQVVLSRMVVETHLGDSSWADVWTHQVRWARTVRLSRGLYLGLPVTFATFWAVVAAVFGHPDIAVGLLALRIAVAVAAGAILRDRAVLRYFWLIPARDLFGAAIWAAGAVGSTVVWRGALLTLGRDGRIQARRAVNSN